jgi:hypothetical protein
MAAISLEHSRLDVGRRAQVWFLESMDRIIRAIQSTTDVVRMMSDVLDELLAIFGCVGSAEMPSGRCDTDFSTSAIPSFGSAARSERPARAGSSEDSPRTSESSSPGTRAGSCRSRGSILPASEKGKSAAKYWILHSRGRFLISQIQKGYGCDATL